jgi:hypothetical protein
VEETQKPHDPKDYLERGEQGGFYVKRAILIGCGKQGDYQFGQPVLLLRGRRQTCPNPVDMGSVKTDVKAPSGKKNPKSQVI